MPDQIDSDGDLTTRAAEEVRAEPAELEVVRPATPPTVVVPESPSPYRPAQSEEPGYQGQYAQPTPPPQPHPYAAPGAPISNGMATTGGILGIVGFVVGWIPFIGIFFGLVLGILAIVFGSIGLSRAGKLPGRRDEGWPSPGLFSGS